MFNTQYKFGIFIILLLFGAKKLPDLARGLGQGMREFRRATNEIQDEIKSATSLDEPPKKVAGNSTEEQKD